MTDEGRSFLLLLVMATSESRRRWWDILILVGLAYITYAFAAPRFLPPSFSDFFQQKLPQSWQRGDGKMNTTLKQDHNKNNSALPPSYGGEEVHKVSTESPLVQPPSNGSFPSSNQSIPVSNGNFLPPNRSFLPSNGSFQSWNGSFPPPNPSLNPSFPPPNKSINGSFDAVSPTIMPSAPPPTISEFSSNASISTESDRDKEPQKNNSSTTILPPPPPPSAPLRPLDEPHAQCLYFDGEWVQDDAYPLYPPSSCPFVEEEFACSENRRPDFNYTTLRWIPRGCKDLRTHFYQEGNYLYPKLAVHEALRKALMTWAQWVKENVDTSTTRVFFRTHSPSHFRGGKWNSGGRCHMQTLPIYNPSFLLPYPQKMKMVERIIWETKIQVKLLNVTRLSDFRKDAHPSIYGHKFQRPGRRQDCSHWCLPGLPDTWNELLYAHLVRPDLYI